MMSTNSKRRGMAVTSLILGILSMVCFGFLTGIPAIILGHIAHGRTRKTPEQFAGSGLAIAGFVMGYASLLTTLIVVLLAGRLLPQLAQTKARAQSIICVNNLKQIGLAFRTWALDNKDRFPVSTNEGVQFQERVLREAGEGVIQLFGRRPGGHRHGHLFALVIGCAAG